jgi:hypothetical protein
VEDQTNVPTIGRNRGACGARREIANEEQPERTCDALVVLVREHESDAPAVVVVARWR